MATYKQLSFSAGEVSPSIYARTDLVKYATGLRTCENFMVMRHGGVTNRPGTSFVGEVKDSSKVVRLIPFIFNTAQTYVLEFGDLYMRVIRNGAQITETAQNITAITQASPGVLTITGHGYADGEEVFIEDVGGMTELNNRNFKIANKTANTFELTYMNGTAVDTTSFTAYTSGGTAARVYTITTPYVEADLSELRFIQSADIVTLTHPSYSPRELARTAHTSWTLNEMLFAPSIAPPINLLSDSPGGTRVYVVTAVDATTNEESLPSVPEYATTFTSTLTWDAVPGAAHYNVYKLRDGIYGWIGLTGTESFTDATIDADVLDEPPIDRQPFLGLAATKDVSGATQADPCVLTVTAHGYSDADEVYVKDIEGMTELNNRIFTIANSTVNTFELSGEDSTAYTAYVAGGTTAKITRTDNQPSTCAYYQQRLIFANTNSDTEGVWSSKSTLRKNFMTSTPLQDDDAVTFSLVGRQVNEIHHLLDLGKLIMFTESGEWVIDGDAAGILTPSGVNPRQHSYNGSGSLAPIVVNNTALYVQARGSVIRDLGYELESDGYRGNELTIFSSHMFDKYTLSDWSYQKIPHSIVWAVRNDGTLLGLTYIREHQVFGWHRHVFAGATVENVCVVPEGTEDVLYLTIKRTINGNTVRYIERMESRQVNNIEDSIFMDCTLSLDGTNTSATTMTLSGGTNWTHDEDLTLTASVADFVSTDVGNARHITGTDGTIIRCTITAYTSTTVVTVRPHKTVPAAMRNVAFTTWGEAVDTVSGLWHIEGEDVSIFADGFVEANPNNDAYTTKTVADGSVTLDSPEVVIHVGLPVTANLETLNIDTVKGATLADKKKQVSVVSLFVEESRGIFAGMDADNLSELKIRNDEGYDDPVDLKTGIAELNITSQWTDEGKVLVRQIDPLPLSVLAIVPGGFLAK